MSGFRNTGAPQDEGQLLQSVYPPARTFGGPGRFGFADGAHLTEDSALVSEANRAELFGQWSRYWDLSKPYLLEKSPPNLIRMRFLQALFPESHFIVLIRHPIAVSLATRRFSEPRPSMRGMTLASLLSHWVQCHRVFHSDAPFIRHLLVVRYEDFVSDPDGVLRTIYNFMGMEPWLQRPTVKPDLDARYLELWQRARERLWYRPYARYWIRKFERPVNEFGYSLTP